MVPALFLVLLAGSATVRHDGIALGSSCGAGADRAAVLRAGDPVQIRFALSGELETCYKVLVTSAGKQVEGYLPASAIDTADFDRTRREGRSVAAPREAPSHADTGGGPANASLLATAGIAAYRDDDPRTAIQYLRQSLELKPDSAVEQFLKNVEQELHADKSSEKIYSTRFLLRYEEAVPAGLARQMVAALEAQYVRISAELGCRADERIVTVVQSREAYRRTTRAAEWSGGRFDGRIHIALLERARIGPETIRVFGHEIVHACLANLGRWPSWLHEGLAQHLTGEQLDPELRRQIQSLASGGKLPKLAALGSDWGRFSALDARIAYGVALAAVEQYYEHHSAYGFRNLLRNPEMLPQIEEDLDRRLTIGE